MYKRILARSFDRAALTYDAAATLQHEVGQRLYERCQYIKLSPQQILDIGCGTGKTTRLLAKRYPDARLVHCDISTSMLQKARSNRSFTKRWFGNDMFCSADMEALPFASNQFDFIFSNLAFQWALDINVLLQECARILKPGGLLLFSTLGPDTLHELRECYQLNSSNQHIMRQIDMHDIGDALLSAQLSDPVIDMEKITLQYTDLDRLLHDLKGIGSKMIGENQPCGLGQRQQLCHLKQAYEKFRLDNQLLPATYEVIYGHAFGQAARRHAGEFEISLDQIGHRQ